MRKSIGMTWVIQFVLIFILIFAAYLALSIKYSKTFKIKNGVIDIIEKYQGVNATSRPLIEEYIDASGYDAKGKCPSIGGWRGINGHAKGSFLSGTYDYCYKLENVPGNTSIVYYKVMLFYKFGLPVIDDIMTFEVEGETIDLPSPSGL